MILLLLERKRKRERRGGERINRLGPNSVINDIDIIIDLLVL